MHTRSLVPLLGWLASSAMSSAMFEGCKEDPPPPLPEPAESEAPAAPSKARPGLMPRVVPAYSDATIKRWRVETCFFGSHGLKLVRDAYLDSLGGSAAKAPKDPGEKHIPSFAIVAGSPTTGPTAPAASASAGKSAAPAALGALSSSAAPSAGHNPLARAGFAGAAPLPFTRFVNTCSLVAGGQEPAAQEPIDKAVADFEPYASALNHTLMAAQRYYAGGQYKNDKFEQGKKYHADLLKSFAELDDRLGALSRAFWAWEAGLPKPSEKLDHAGDVAALAMDKARAVVAAALADKVDGSALKRAVDELDGARSALDAAGKDDPQAPHPPELLPRLAVFSAAAADAERALKDGKLPEEKIDPLTDGMAELCEANHRATGAVLRMTGQVKPAGPLTTIRPSLRGRPTVPVIPR